MEVEVIFPYEPQQEDELRLQVGDIITHVEQLEKGWGKGILNSVPGVFPDNFVRVLTASRKLMRSQEISEMKTSVHQPPVERRDSNVRRCRVIYSYSPQHEDELALCAGDVINVLQEVEEGWWKGILKGKIGMFPSNFVEECEQSEESRVNIYSMEPKNTELNGNPQSTDTTGVIGWMDQNEVMGSAPMQPSVNSAFEPVSNPKAQEEIDGNLKSKERNEINSSKSSKMLANSLEKEKMDSSSTLEKDKITISVGDRKISKQSNGIGTKKQITAKPSQIHAGPPQLPPKPVREMARVLFPYTAEHDDELELIEGDLITILNKELEDKGWWKGEIGGKVGVFPDNFVQIISQEEIVKPPRPEKRPNYLAQHKTAVSANVEQEPPTSKEKEPTPPPLPNKKVGPPPLPTEKKPDTLHKTNGILHENPSSEPNSLTLTRETPLTHMQRPKGPSNRRPPSQLLKENKTQTIKEDENTSLEENVVLNDSTQEEKNENVSNGHDNSANSEMLSSSPTSSPADPANKPPWLRELRENQKKKRLSGIFTQNGEEEIRNGLSSSPPALPSRSSPQSVKEASKGPSVPPSQQPPLKIRGMSEADVGDGNAKAQPPILTPPQSTTSSISPSQVGSLKLSSKMSPDNPGGSLRLSKGSSPDKVNGSIEEEAPGGNLAAKVDRLYKELVPKVRSLETRMEEQNMKHLAQVQLLTKELDDERKLRACLQIEVDRLKKLLTTGYAHV